jgi:hypothetical protein
MTTSATTPFDVYRAAVVAAIRDELDTADDERFDELANAYRGIRRTTKGRQAMIHDWIGHEVVVTPRIGMQAVGVLSGVDDTGLALEKASPVMSPAIRWGEMHFPWSNISHTRLAPPTTTTTKKRNRS